MYDLQSVIDFDAALGAADGAALKGIGITRKRCRLKEGRADGAVPEYCIYKYDRKALSADKYATRGMIRSVITKGDRIVCYSPPKALSWASVAEDICSLARTDGSVVVEEFVEGIMINVFYDDDLGEYVCATKSSVGGNVSFFDNGKYPPKTFGKMFDEVCEAVGLRLPMLDREHCYSFVMQHPEYRIVRLNDAPALYLVATYRIDNATRRVYHVKPACGAEALMSPSVSRVAIAGTRVKNVARFHMDVELTVDALYRKVCDVSNERGVDGLLQGLVVAYYDSDGVYRRVKVRDSRYQQIKALRGNNPKLEYQYLVLRASGRVVEYLQYYPEHKKLFMQYKTKVEAFSNHLYQYYREVHILKADEGPPGECDGGQRPALRSYDAVPFECRKHVRELHGIYRTSLRPNKGRVNFDVVKKYVNLLAPAKLMFSLNYRMRASSVEAAVAVEDDGA